MTSPWLVQRMNFEDRGGDTLDGIMRLDYMGSAEFEFGALPQSLKRITSAVDDMEVIELPSVKRPDGDGLFFVAKRQYVSEYADYIAKIVSNEHHMKESSYMDMAVSGVAFSGDKITKSDWGWVDAWWDIENDIMWTFGKPNADKLLTAIVATRDKKRKENITGWF